MMTITIIKGINFKFRNNKTIKNKNYNNYHNNSHRHSKITITQNKDKNN
jgi:hypothetical protein